MSRNVNGEGGSKIAKKSQRGLRKAPLVLFGRGEIIPPPMDDWFNEQ